MWTPPASKLPLVLVLLAACGVGGFAMGLSGAMDRSGPPARTAATEGQPAAPAADAVPLGAPLVEDKKAPEKPKEEPKEEEVKQDAPPPAPEAPPPAKPVAPADPVGDVIENSKAAPPPPPDVPY